MSADGGVKRLNVAKHIAACFLSACTDVLANPFMLEQLGEAFWAIPCKVEYENGSSPLKPLCDSDLL